MTKLFRGVKANLIDNGKFKKYLLYALGEVVLVVIGIVLAVQFNNMIESNKRHDLEIETLQEIKANLEGDLLEIEDELTNYDNMIDYDSVVIAAMQHKLPFTDSLGAYSYTVEENSHFNPTLSGYNMLESKGIDLITDDSLRIQLTDLYERWYLYYKKYEDERIHMVQTVFKPFMIKNFYLEDYVGFWTKRKRMPFSYEALLKDPEWISVLQTNRGLAIVLSVKARGLKHDMQTVHQRIKKYLNTNKKRDRE